MQTSIPFKTPIRKALGSVVQFLLCMGCIVIGSLHSKAQSKNTSLNDTLLLQEISVVECVPINDNQTRRHIGDINCTSIDKVNARLASVSLISRGAFAMEPMLHSFSAGQINVTIDGMKIFGACTDKMDPITSYVEPVNLQSIDIQLGSNGSENGSTVGGSFNMRLRKARLNTISAQAGTKIESTSKGISNYASFNVGRKKWAYRLSANHKDYGSYTNGANELVPFTQYKKINLHQSLVIIPKAEHRILIDFLLDDAYNIGYPALPMDVGEAKGRIASIEYWPQSPSEKIRGLRMKLYANSIYHLMDDSRRDSLYFVQNSATGTQDSVFMRMDMPGWSSTAGFQLESKVDWHKKHVLHLKMSSYVNRSKAEMTMFMNNVRYPGEAPMFAETWPEHQRTEAGFYLKDNYKLNERHSFSLSYRIDRSWSVLRSETGIQQLESVGYTGSTDIKRFTQSGNFIWAFRPIREISLQLGTGIGERLPTLTEQYGYYLFSALDGYDYIGQPDLKNEVSVNGWVSILYTKPSFKVKAGLYLHQLSNYILPKQLKNFTALNLYASGVKQYENIPSAQIIAANIQATWMPIKQLELFSQLKYNYGQKQDQLSLPLIQPLKLLSALTFRHKNYWVRTELEAAAQQDRINEDFGEARTSGYTLTHLRTGFSFMPKWGKVTFGVALENLFNKAYSEHLDWGNFYRSGRNITASLGVSF